MHNEGEPTRKLIKAGVTNITEEYVLRKCREVFGSGMHVLDSRLLFYPYYKAQVAISIRKPKTWNKIVLGLVELVEGHTSVIDELREGAVEASDYSIIPPKISIAQARRSLLTSISMMIAQETRLTTLPHVEIENELELYIPFWVFEVAGPRDCEVSRRIVFDGLIGSYCFV